MTKETLHKANELSDITFDLWHLIAVIDNGHLQSVDDWLMSEKSSIKIEGYEEMRKKFLDEIKFKADALRESKLKELESL